MAQQQHLLMEYIHILGIGKVQLEILRNSNGLCEGEYQVKVTDAIGCSKIESVKIALDTGNYVPQTYYDDIFTVFPNPATNEFTIDYKKDDFKNISINITDIKGSLILESKMTSNKSVIKNLKAGIYFVNLRDKNGIIAVQRVVVTK